MRNRERHPGKQIDALGILALCVVVAIIIGCVIAQIKIFKATGWQLLPSEPLVVHARSSRTEIQAESPNSSAEAVAQHKSSRFNSEPFGYIRLDDGTAVSLESGRIFSPSATAPGTTRFSTTGEADSTSPASPSLRTGAPRTFLEQLTTGLETDSIQAEWKLPARLPTAESPVLKTDLARNYIGPTANHITGSGP
jgi:hypothetical protein